MTEHADCPWCEQLPTPPPTAPPLETEPTEEVAHG